MRGGTLGLTRQGPIPESGSDWLVEVWVRKAQLRMTIGRRVRRVGGGFCAGLHDVHTANFDYGSLAPIVQWWGKLNRTYAAVEIYEAVTELSRSANRLYMTLAKEAWGLERLDEPKARAEQVVQLYNDTEAGVFQVRQWNNGERGWFVVDVERDYRRIEHPLL